MDRRSFIFGAAKAAVAVSTVSFFDMNLAWMRHESKRLWDQGWCMVQETMSRAEFERQYAPGISMRFIKSYEVTPGPSSKMDILYGWGKLPEGELQLSELHDPGAWGEAAPPFPFKPGQWIDPASFDDAPPLKVGDIVEFPHTYKVNPITMKVPELKIPADLVVTPDQLIGQQRADYEKEIKRLSKGLADDIDRRGLEMFLGKELRHG
jgi:hypothetical protein